MALPLWSPAPRQLSVIWLCLWTLFGIWLVSNATVHSGVMYWRRVSTSNRQISITTELGLDWKFFGQPLGNENIYVGDVTVEAQDQPLVTLPLRVNVASMRTDEAQPWFLGIGSVTYEFPENVASVSIVYQRCCRLSNLLELNARTLFRLQSKAVFQSYTGPSVTTVPRLFLDTKVLQVWAIPSVRGTYTASLGMLLVPPASSSGLNVHLPCGQDAITSNYNNCPGGQLVPTVDTAQWNPQRPGLYAVQHHLYDQHGSTGVLEYLIEVQPVCGGCGPRPSIDNLIYEKTNPAVAGVAFAASFSATAGTTLITSPLPAGMTIAPNQQGYLLTWTPNQSSASLRVCFQLRKVASQSPSGFFYSSGLTCITNQVADWYTFPSACVGTQNPNCGLGLQNRNPDCRLVTNPVAAISNGLCQASKTSPSATSPCSLPPCAYEYGIGEWGQCIAGSCGLTGTQVRIVSCRVIPTQGGDESTQPLSTCELALGPIPATSQVRNRYCASYSCISACFR